MHLSVIVPAYNEGKVLDSNIRLYYEYLNSQPYDFEMIIVNDGSTDDTAAIARRLSRDLAGVKMVDNHVNCGKGDAVCRGFKSGQGDYRLFLDADNATSIDHLGKAWPFFSQGYDIVIGSRSPKDAPGTRQVKPQARWKRQLGQYGNKLIRSLVIKDIWDTQCGFKILSRAACEKIVPNMTISGFGFDVEMLTLGRLFGYRIAAIPLQWVNADNSHVKLSSYFSVLHDVYRIKRNLASRKYG